MIFYYSFLLISLGVYAFFLRNIFLCAWKNSSALPFELDDDYYILFL